MVEATYRIAGLPRAPEIDHQAPIILEDAFAAFCEWLKPTQVSIFLLVPILLLACQREWRTRHDQINACHSHALHHLKAVGKIDMTAPRDVINWEECFLFHQSPLNSIFFSAIACSASRLRTSTIYAALPVMPSRSARSMMMIAR